jgi:nitrogen fixation NifU-like protein
MDYSPTILDHFSNPRNVGELLDADAVGTAGTPGRGNYLVLYLKLAEGCITDCGFLTYGCPPAIAAGSVLTELLKGMPTEQARNISAADIEAALGGLPLGKKHCAALAAEALKGALDALSEA